MGCVVVKDWEQYKDLEYYPDRVCACGCGGRIKVRPYHEYHGIPKYISGHNRRGKHQSKHQIEVMKNLWADPEWRELMVQKNRESHRTPEYREKQSKKMIVAHNTPEFLENHSIIMKEVATRPGVLEKRAKGIAESWKDPICRANRIQGLVEAWQDPEWREMMIQKNKEGHNTPDSIENQSQKQRKNWADPEYREKQIEIFNHPKVKMKHRTAAKKYWADPEVKERHLKAIFKGLMLLPNNPEKFLIKLLQELLPNQWKYIGDGKDEDSIIVGKCPDFICVSQKKIIEHFGDYHHGEGVTGIPNEQHEQERIDLFAKEGYQTLIIWEHELKNIKEVSNRILKFHGGSYAFG